MHIKNNKVFSKKTSILIIVAVVIFIIYTAAIDPIIKWAYFPGEVFSSVDTYISGDYLSFDSGIEMQKFINNYEFINTKEPLEFYYIDNSKRDNIFYGKMCDIYILEFDITNENYLQLESNIKNFNGGMLVKHLSYEIYCKHDKEKELLYCIAIDENHTKLRYIVIDNCETSSPTSILIQQSPRHLWSE